MRHKFFIFQPKFLLVMGVISGIALVVLAIVVSSTQCSWTGFGRCVETTPKDTQIYRAKTLWDWLQLLIIPVFLASGAAFLARLDKAKEERLSENRAALQFRLAQDQQCEDALQHYFDRTTDLLMSGNLKKAPIDPEPGSEGERIIRVNLAVRGRTLALLRRLDGVRKGQVIRFLEELHLIQEDNLVIPLQGADLQEAQLAGQHLAKINLRDVDLTNANLQDAYLAEANLSSAKMQHVNLSGAFLRRAVLLSTDLTKANLEGANLEGCIADGAKFVDASLHRTLFTELETRDKERNIVVKRATLAGVDFTRATLDDAKFEGAWLPGARFREAQLLRVKFSRCDISDADFSEANLIVRDAFEECVGVAKMPNKSLYRMESKL